MKWFLARLGFAEGIGFAVVWFIRYWHGPTWAALLAAAVTGVVFFAALTAVGEAFARMDQITADAAAESQALSSLRTDDAAPVMTKREERVDPFDNVPELLASAAVERRTDVLAEWRRRRSYQGSRRVGAK